MLKFIVGAVLVGLQERLMTGMCGCQGDAVCSHVPRRYRDEVQNPDLLRMRLNAKEKEAERSMVVKPSYGNH